MIPPRAARRCSARRRAGARRVRRRKAGEPSHRRMRGAGVRVSHRPARRPSSRSRRAMPRARVRVGRRRRRPRAAHGCRHQGRITSRRRGLRRGRCGRRRSSGGATRSSAARRLSNPMMIAGAAAGRASNSPDAACRRPGGLPARHRQVQLGGSTLTYGTRRDLQRARCRRHVGDPVARPAELDSVRDGASAGRACTQRAARRRRVLRRRRRRRFRRPGRLRRRRRRRKHFCSVSPCPYTWSASETAR